jgi:hypothetical protein
LGFVVEELKLTTIPSIAMLSNFTVVVVVNEDYNKIKSKKVSAGKAD